MTTNRSSTAKPIVTSICPTCGCSLIRLGIGSDRWTTCNYGEKQYFFCCQGCTDLFSEDPPKYLKETKDLVVCPTCLAEKPVQWTVRMEISDWEVYFCRCPYCPELFRKNPDYYVRRLKGKETYEGVFGQEGCCSADEIEPPPTEGSKQR
jgi:YHS domain-containing protein